ncbi:MULTISPECIES: TetR/AcrR family transcriptional regulator [Subtercola]|uniref:TetR/AcrR family transcriptional regulator n=1 Tax=Subtercola vilae TaxID=2056433 RepID=A0A4V4RG97_9MICO|nr:MULTISPECIES: TetR/AcrR family transcriptional regulator [Subtercola]MEA9984040.1 TetR/AcrR family transcriptional regulator [Subtercola sp. RTI3]TIH41004.1 TetR/AcrR family transcriptional regulator [Subtercola vilae]
MTLTGKLRGSYAKTSLRRREIVMAGLEVFATSGYRSGSLREIAERVGMSQAGLLHHFSNKSELLAAVLEARDDDARMRVPLDSAGIELIRGLVELVRYNASIPGLVELHCVLSAEATDPEHPAHQYFIARYQWSIGISTEAFADMKERGQLVDGVDPASAARSLVALMDGLQVQWLLDRTSVVMVDEVHAYVARLLSVPL